MADLKDIELFLLDMDGTVSFEDQLIEGAAEFIQCLRDQNKRFIFVTNNSSDNAGNYVKKMNRLGIPCGEENVFTSGMAMGLFLTQNRRDKTVYLSGTKALREELLSYGIPLVDEDAERVDIVVIGFDKELTYKRLTTACRFLVEGSEFLATNVDLVCPMKNKRYIPDCGSICRMLTTATGKEPVYIGKPARHMIDILSQKYGVPQDRVAMVGDRLYTDVATGINAGAVSICVLSGETSAQMLSESDLKPDYVFDSVRELHQALK